MLLRLVAANRIPVVRREMRGPHERRTTETAETLRSKACAGIIDDACPGAPAPGGLASKRARYSLNAALSPRNLKSVN